MIQSVAAYIKEHNLLKADGLVLVALSGGADSVALVHVLKALGYALTALHCNFHLRGEESDRDQQFVETLCQRADIPLLVKHFNTKKYARQNRQSIEMAARDLRYDWFRQEITTQKAQAIAVGHHMNDQAETVILNLLRGTGIRGLAAMHPKQGNIVRPLLGTTRQKIEEYLSSHGLSYITDSSNLEQDVLRNRVRLEVMPLLADLQPAVIPVMARAAENIKQSLPYYTKGIDTAMKDNGFTEDTLNIAVYQEKGRPFILLHEWLHPFGFNNAQINDIRKQISGQPGGIWESQTHRLLRDREQLLLQAKTDNDAPPAIHQRIVSEIGKKEARYAYLDADLITEPLTIRRPQSGDWFIPFGMKGRKLVSDFLTNLKLSRFQKEQQWIVCHGNDIVWIAGKRPDNRFAVTKQTKRILQLELEQN